MPKISKVGRSRPARRRWRVPSAVLQWAIVVIVVAAAVGVLVRTLSNPPAERPMSNILSTAKTDLVSETRMLGRVGPDSVFYSLVSPALRSRLAGPDTLLTQNRWYDAANIVQGALNKAQPDEAAQLRAYMALCFLGAASPDRAVMELRRGLDSHPGAMEPWLAFALGYTFQIRGYQDSAQGYYRRADRSLAGVQNQLHLAVLNNLGLADEALADTAAAVAAYDSARALSDTSADARDARALRDNIRRLAERTSRPAAR